MAGPARADVWKLLGPPMDQIGSVNDPRVREEYGTTWNEKWVYRRRRGAEVERVVLWNRYDFAGSFRVKADGEAERETLSSD